MSQHILIGIDTDLSPATQFMLRTASELFPSQQFILIHVIPMPQMMTAHAGFYMSQSTTFAPTTRQYQEAEELLRKARLIMYQHGVDSRYVQTVIRTGMPVEELIRATVELQAKLIIVSGRGNSFSQRLRRLVLGSISHTVLRDATCPVLIVSPPRQPHPPDLVTWYRDEIRRYLKEHPGDLAIFAPAEAALAFIPPYKQKAGRKEIAAAAQALEQLAKDGLLYRRDVKGELRYAND